MIQYVSHEDAAKALDSLDDYARMGTGVDAHGPRGMLERYIAQQAATLRQAPAQGGVTEAMSSIEDAIACGQMNAPKVFTKMRELVIAALSAQPLTVDRSPTEALNLLEEWVGAGGALHGDDAPRLRALADRIAPQQQGQGEAISADDIDAMRAAAMEIQHNNEPWFPMTDRRMRRAAAALLARHPAPPAQPAERVPEDMAVTVPLWAWTRIEQFIEAARIFRSHAEGYLSAINEGAPADADEPSEVFDACLRQVDKAQQAASPASSPARGDAARYAFVSKAFNDMTISQSEWFLELLGIEGNVFAPLNVAIDNARDTRP